MMLPDSSVSEEISPQQLAEMLESTEVFTLIDCRELDEWHFNRIEGARHFPLSKFPEIAQSLLPQSESPMVVYCHHGMRSLHATRWLRQQGCHHVFSLQGGIATWSAEIDPSIPCY